MHELRECRDIRAFKRSCLFWNACAAGVIVVTIDKSLKRKGRLARLRSVMTRDERIAQMQTDERWPDGSSPFGLPKLRVVRLVVGKKKKKKTAEGDAKKDDKKKAAKKK